jgi:hypothetical protein
MNVSEAVDSLLNHMPLGAVVKIKQGWFWNALSWIVKIVTFGKNDKFGLNYTTTIGKTISMPIAFWDSRKQDPFMFFKILNHELTHVRQAYRLGRGSFWLGMILYPIMYLFLPLPLGLAYFRYTYERDAYVAGFKSVLPFYYNEAAALADLPLDINFVYNQLTSGLYGWTMGLRKDWARGDIEDKFYRVFNEFYATE